MTLKPAVQWSRLPIDQFNLRLSKGGPITLTGERIHLGNDLVSGPVKAKIENPKAPWLDFETTVDSSYAAQAAFLRRSPLASKVEGALSAIDTAARLNTKIVLRQPLKKTLGAPDFRVTTAFEGADITLKAADISLVNSSGAVEIVPKRVYAEDLAFNYLGQRFRGDFELKDGVLEANAAGEAYLSRVLKQWFEPLAKGVTGKTPVEIALSMDLAKKPGDFELAVSTALTGVTRRWPAPARKLNPNQAAAETFSAIKTNGQLKFALKNSNGNVVLTQLGSNQWDGSVSCRTLDPLGWAGFFAGGGGNAGLSLKLKVDCDQMALGNQRIPNPTAQLFIENAVQVSVDADGLNGSIGVDAAGAVVARFADMDTRFWQTAEDISIGDALSSADLPRLTLGIDSAHVAGYPLQQVNLSAIPDGEVWNIQWAQAAVAGARFSATGLVSGGTSARTSVQWSADIDNAQTALTQLGYSVQISGQGEAEGTLGWVGFPWQVDKNRLNGELRVNLKKGALRDVDPGAGKLLALLNIARLPARFANSVSDLEQGFTFDQLAARVQLVPGFAYNDPVVIQGPVAVVEMRGSTDLNSEQVLQEVLVVPSLTSSVPLVGLLAGGPVTGIGAFIVERLLGEAGIDFNQVAAQRYSVTGTLDNPQMVQQ
ncbi:MAG: hypothetical protein HWE20_07065 [Gammaproteobacteria bacterium]|nr:hypothetical protein [Gammaproteobacteria bacterium]